MQLDILREIYATSKLAAPLAAANLAQTAMGVTDTVMLGRLSGKALAVAGLGAAAYFTVGTILQGTISATTTLAAHAFSAGDRDALGRIATAGLLVAALMTLPFIAALTNFGSLIQALGYESSLVAEIRGFLQAIGWGAPAFLGFGALRCLVTAMSRTTPVLVVIALGICLNAWLDWLLIYGNFGAPTLAAKGSGYATALTQWFMFLSLIAYFKSSAALSATYSFDRLISRVWPEIKHVFQLGLPIAGAIAIDVGVFGAVGIAMGLIGEDALAAHQVVLSFASLALMVALGFAQAANVRVASWLGADRPDVARRAAIVALALGTVIMAAVSIMLWTTHAVLSLYIDIENPANQGIIHIANSCLAIAAMFLIFDAVQAIAAGALRGYKDVNAPMLFAAIGYWVAGLPAGWVLAFPLGYGAVGLWSGLALGLAVVATLLTIRLFRIAAARCCNVDAHRCRQAQEPR